MAPKFYKILTEPDRGLFLHTVCILSRTDSNAVKYLKSKNRYYVFRKCILKSLKILTVTRIALNQEFVLTHDDIGLFCKLMKNVI